MSRRAPDEDDVVVERVRVAKHERELVRRPLLSCLALQDGEREGEHALDRGQGKYVARLHPPAPALYSEPPPAPRSPLVGTTECEQHLVPTAPWLGRSGCPRCVGHAASRLDFLSFHLCGFLAHQPSVLALSRETIWSSSCSIAVLLALVVDRTSAPSHFHHRRPRRSFASSAVLPTSLLAISSIYAFTYAGFLDVHLVPLLLLIRCLRALARGKTAPVN